MDLTTSSLGTAGQALLALVEEISVLREENENLREKNKLAQRVRIHNGLAFRARELQITRTIQCRSHT